MKPDWSKLKDLPPRREGYSQRQLAAVIGGTHQMISDIERRALRKLAVALLAIEPTMPYEPKVPAPRLRLRARTPSSGL